MIFSRKSRIFFLFFHFLIFGCSTTQFKILYQSETATEFSVSPDRVLLECEWIHDADIEGLYGFMIHILDAENTVISVIQGNTLDGESCNRRILEIEMILRNGAKIYIAGIGDLIPSDLKSNEKYKFPRHGIFPSNSKSLQFVAIANEYGECYEAYAGLTHPCPQAPFPHYLKQ